jgi:hypothetical protein
MSISLFDKYTLYCFVYSTKRQFILTAPANTHQFIFAYLTNMESCIVQYILGKICIVKVC